MHAALSTYSRTGRSAHEENRARYFVAKARLVHGHFQDYARQSLPTPYLFSLEWRSFVFYPPFFALTYVDRALLDRVWLLLLQADVQSTMGVLFFVAINQGILGTIGVLQVTLTGLRYEAVVGSIYPWHCCEFHTIEVASVGIWGHLRRGTKNENRIFRGVTRGDTQDRAPWPADMHAIYTFCLLTSCTTFFFFRFHMRHDTYIFQVFPNEMPVFLREHDSGAYRVSSYFFGRTVVSERGVA